MYHIFADNNLIYQPENPKLRLINPKLTVEMGKAGSLEFGLPPTHEHYGNLQQLKTLLTVYMDNEELFRGRVFSNKRNFNNVRDIYGEGNLSYLVDSVQMGEKYTGKSHALFRKIIAAHNAMVKDSWKQFEVGNITVDNVDVFLAGQSEEIEDQETGKFNYKQIAINSITDNWQTSFDYIESCLIDYEGGYLRTRYDATTGKTYIDWLKDYYGTATQTIEFGKNMLDLTEESSPEELFTVLIPLGDENLTIESVNNGSKELANADLVAKYGRIVKTNIFDNVTNPQTLLENGRRYLANNAAMEVTITITAVDLHLINPSIRSIYLGDKVHVLSPGHELNDRDLVCTKIEYDLANPANTVYTFGKPKQTLTERYRKDKKAQDAQTGRSGGGGGGGAGDKNDEEIKKTKEFFEGWIKVEEEEKLVTIGAIYKRFTDESQKTTEMARVLGINLDAPQGEIDIFALDGTSKKNAKNIAELQVKVDESGKSIISMDADLVTVKSEVLNIDDKVLKFDGKIKALEGKFDELDAGTLWVDKTIRAKSLYAELIGGDTIRIGDNDIMKHKHKLTVVDGTVYLGAADYSGSGYSFNIADTKYFKDAVSAAGAASLTYTTSILKNTSNPPLEYYHIKVNAKNKDGNVIKSREFDTSTSVYRHGRDSVTINYADMVKTGSGTSGGGWIKVKATATNGKSQERTFYI